MDGAALLLLAAGVGVNFGWQPMPDGSARYEYIVQVDPALAERLHGQTVPIAGEIPEEIQPIGRVRVVVGEDEPPRQRLVTRLKPVADENTPAEADGGVQLAQFSQQQYADPANQRYGPITQPSPYAQQPAAQQSAAPPAGEMQWNNESPGAIAPTPTNQQLFGATSSEPSTTWNNPLRAAAATQGDGSPLTQVGSALQQTTQQAAQQLVNGLNQAADTSLRDAANALGSRTENLINELRQPVDRVLGAAPQSLGQPAPQNSGTSEWNQSPAFQSPTYQPSTSPTSSGVPQTSAPGVFPPQSSVTQPAAQPQQQQQQTPTRDWNAPPPTSSSPANQPSTGPSPDELWRNVSDERLRTPSPSPPPPAPTNDIPNLASRPAPFGGQSADWNSPDVSAPQIPVLDPPQNNASTAPTTSANSSPGSGTGAAIGRDMLNQPANRPLDGAAADVAPTTPVSAPASTPTTSWPPASETPTNQQAPAAASATPASEGAAKTGDNAALVLAAWVLLSGSVAGNVYLFWSYLDIRQKYRSLVRKTARAVGRFSVA